MDCGRIYDNLHIENYNLYYQSFDCCTFLFLCEFLSEWAPSSCAALTIRQRSRNHPMQLPVTFAEQLVSLQLVVDLQLSLLLGGQRSE